MLNFSFDKVYTQWTWERISRHIIWWGFWITFYGIVNGSYHDDYGNWLLLELMIMTVKIPYAYLVAYYLLPKFLPSKRYVRLVAFIILLSFVGIGLIIEITKLMPVVMYGQPTSLFESKTFYRMLDLIYGVSLVVIIKILQQYAQQRKINTQLKEEKTSAEFQILKNQLQPHFLFNTLNNIYSMVLLGDKEAAASVLRLSSIMSYMLYECNGNAVDLNKELTLIKDYIELEKLRYGDRLDLSLEVSGPIKGKIITPLLLLPFVENAFKHGVSTNEKKSWIRINIQVIDDDLVFMIENSILPLQENNSAVKSGIGLNNVRKRLELLYPGKHQLKITVEDTYLVNLKIQL